MKSEYTKAQDIINKARLDLTKIYNHDGESCDLSCGYKLELFVDDEWVIGRVEARGNGEYYFYGSNRPSLIQGMRVRKRLL